MEVSPAMLTATKAPARPGGPFKPSFGLSGAVWEDRIPGPRKRSRALIAALFLCACLGVPASSFAQAATGRKTSAPALRTECVLSAGLCVTVPASWQRLGNVFDDLGFVVAEPHPGVDSADWPQLTVVAIPPTEQDKGSADATSSATPSATPSATSSASPSLDSLADRLLAPGGSLPPSRTLQRSRLLLNGAPAEILRVQLYDQAGNAGAIEEVALIEGDDGLFYSIALRCAPQELARLEALFQQSAASWHIQPAPASPSNAPPKADSGKK